MALLRWMREIFKRNARVSGVALRWMGVGLLVLAFGFWLNAWMQTRPLRRTTGTITDNAASFAVEGGVQYFPRIRFRADGQLMQVLTKQGSEEAEFAPGDTVPVLYVAANPAEAVIATRWRLYHVAITLAVLGVIFFDLGLLFRYGPDWWRAWRPAAST